MHIDLYEIVKGQYTLAVGGGHTKQPYNHQKKAAWCNQSSLRIL